MLTILFRIINCALAASQVEELMSCCSVKIITKYGSVCLFKLLMMSHLSVVQECYTAVNSITEPKEDSTEM